MLGRKLKGIIKLAVVLMLLAVISKPLWTNSYWPEGYYKKNYSNSLNKQKQKETDLADQHNKETAEEETTKQTNQEKSTFSLDYYNQLSDKQKSVYNQIKTGCEKYQKRVKIDALDEKDYEVALYALKCDYPEFYWLNYAGKYMQKNNKVYEHIFSFDDNPESTRKKIRKEADKIVEKANKKDNTYDKLKCLHDELINLVKYKKSKRDQEIRSVFLDKETVCNGYAEAFVYLCKQCNINCAYARGTSLNESHAWNIVEIDGKYCWIDITWDDSESIEDSREQLNYVYFCVPDERFSETHKLDCGTDINRNKSNFKFTYPKCDSEQFNYYKREGGYFTSYSRKTVGKYIKKKAKNSNTIELMFKTKSSYEKAREDLCINSVLADMIGSAAKSYKYIDDNNNYYLMIML